MSQLGIRPLHALSSRYDAVVIGSGYGGAIAASRLARAGLAVAVFEKGRRVEPSDMPRSPAAVMSQTCVRTEGVAAGARDALLRYEIGDKMVGLGVGIGGGSLINSAVYRRPDPRVFDDPCWPAQLREEAAGLDAYFERVGAWLQARPYAKRRSLPRTSYFEAMGADQAPEALNIGVAETAGTNVHGSYQPACHGCGECNVGCRTGAKNSLDKNYLPDAVRHGAQLFAGVSVTHVRPAPGGGWWVAFTADALHRDRFVPTPLEVWAERVVLAAGVLGSTGILQRSAALGLTVSSHLGQHVSANGSYLAFVDGLDRETGMQGQTFATHSGGVSGPGITQALTLSGERLAEDILVEDGANPSFVDPLWPSVVAALGRPALEATRAAANASQVDLRRTVNLLCMGHDGSLGRLEASDGDDPILRWPAGPREAFRARLDARLEPLAKAIGGRYAPLGDQATVHPLGGCVMADTVHQGVVDHRGAVFDGQSDASVHPGLFVMDGSVVPRSLGCNPSWTIGALAERAVELLLSEEGRTISYAPRTARTAAAPVPPVVRFTERMTGWVGLGLGHDAARGAALAEASGQSAQLTITVVFEDVDALRNDRSTEAHVLGTARIHALSDAPLTVLGGSFRLFVPDGERIDRWTMEYDLPLHGTERSGLRLVGRKHLSPGNPWVGLRQTTTLEATLLDDTGPIGSGVLSLSLADLIRQLATMRGGGPSRLAGVRSVRRFLGVFTDQIQSAWLGPLNRRVKHELRAPPRRMRALDAPAPTLHDIEAGDGAALLLERYAGGDRGPVMLVGGYAMTSELFRLDTMDRNLVETLCAEGFDVWVLLWRSSPSVPASRVAFTLDDVAAHDHRAAIDYIRATTGADRVHAVAHCLGAVSLAMAQMSGAIDGLGSLVLMQAAAHMELPPITQVKVLPRIPSLLDRLGVQALPAGAHTRDPIPLRLADEVLRLWPQMKGGGCRSAACRRTSFLYGDLWNHDRISAATHDRLPFIVGRTAVRPFRQLTRIGQHGFVVDHLGRDRYRPGLSRLDLPITFLWSEQSGVFGPGATRRTHDALVERFGQNAYRWQALPGYGHLDSLVGDTAHEDVYPHILEHLNRWVVAPKRMQIA